MNAKRRNRGLSKKMAFLAAYRLGPSVARAAACVPIDRTLHYRWLKSDPDYRARFQLARAAAAKNVKASTLRAARRFADHEQRIAKLEAELRRLKAALKR